MWKSASLPRRSRSLSLALAMALLALLSPLVTASPYPLKVERQEHGRGVDLTIVNQGPAPVTVIVELTYTKNTGFSPAVIGRKYPHFVPAGERKKIATAVPLKLAKPAEFGFRYQFAFGDAQAVHNSQFVYRLPIADDTRGVIRPYTGAFLRTTRVDTTNALEVLLPVGTAVVAARAGVVIDVRASKADDSDSQKPSEIGNYVSVLHEDGTWATYGWLLEDSLMVSVGDRVAEGQKIGLSGSNPDSIESYVLMVVNRNWFGLELRSVPIRVRTAGDEIIDASLQSGQVSPNLKPKYPVQSKDEPVWEPPEELMPTPKLPVDWNDDHLTPTQRAALFRQRMAEASSAVGTESVSGSRPLFFLAITGVLLGIVGATIANSTHGTTRPAGGLRGALWFMLHGRARLPAPDGSMPRDASAGAVADGTKVFEGASLAPVSRAGPPSSGVHTAAAPEAEATDVAAEESEDHREFAAHKPLFSSERLQLLALINQSLPSSALCTPSVPLTQLCGDALPAELADAVADFVLVDAHSGEPRACVLFTGDQSERTASMHVSQRLSLAGIPAVTFETVPKRSELKARLKRFLS